MARPRTTVRVNGPKPCTHVKAKTPSDEGICVPQVGLEVHSRPREHWELCGNMRNPAKTKPSAAQSEAQSVENVHTWDLAHLAAFNDTTHDSPHRGDVTFLDARNDQDVQLQLGILAGSADKHVSQLSHQADLTRKVQEASLAETFRVATRFLHAGRPDTPPARAVIGAGLRCLRELLLIATPGVGPSVTR
jgi:hypothetical protein